MSDLDFSKLMPAPKGGRTCNNRGCGKLLDFDFPGVCDECGRKRERRRDEERCMDAVTSIGIHYRWATFESEELAARCGSVACRLAQGALASLCSGQCETIILRGPAGSGKTSLGCAMLRELLERDPKAWYSARFVSVLELSHARTDSSLGEIPCDVKEAKRAAIIVLDDLGQETVGSDVVREVIHARHDADLPMIVTTWKAQEQIQERYGDGTDRRLFERGAVIDLSHRGIVEAAE